MPEPNTRPAMILGGACIQSRGSVTQAEMYRVFNMGLGMLLIAAPESLALLQSLIPEKIYEVGELIPGEKKVVLR